MSAASITSPQALAAVYAAATVTATIIGGVAWQRRRNGHAAIGLIVTMLGAGIWAAADVVTALGLWGVAPAASIDVAQLSIFPAAAVVVAGLWCMSRALADRAWRLTGRRALVLGIHPLVMTALVLGPWRDALLPPPVREAGRVWVSDRPTTAFWLHVAVSYALIGWSLVMLVRTAGDGNGLQRRQALSLLVGAAVPIVVNGISTIQQPPPGSRPDLTGVAFVVTGMSSLYGLLRQGVLQLVPVARGLVLGRLPDAVLVVDADDRLLDANPAGEALLRAIAPNLPPQLAGLATEEILRDADLASPVAAGEHSVETPDGRRVLDVRIEDLTDHRSHRFGRVYVARDVTELHAQRQRLLALNERLRSQLDINDRLRADLAEQAARDELTGLHNRRHLMATLDAAVEVADARGGLCVVMIDIDHFKSVNDDHGHATGDVLLTAVATALSAGVRNGDTLARYGGEEFVLLLPGTTIDDAVRRAEELRRRCGAVTVAGPDGPVSRTVSMGVADAGSVPGAVTAAALLQRADEALYAAKRAGRDQLVVAGAAR